MWVTKSKDAPWGYVSEEWKWWSTNTELKCVVLFGEGAGWSGESVFSRASTREPLTEREPYDGPFPQLYRFTVFDDPCEKRAVPAVKAIVAHREFSKDLIRFLVNRFQHVSYLTLHGSSSLYDPREALAL
jgi:hypothetical protein